MRKLRTIITIIYVVLLACFYWCPTFIVSFLIKDDRASNAIGYVSNDALKEQILIVAWSWLLAHVIIGLVVIFYASMKYKRFKRLNDLLNIRPSKSLLVHSIIFIAVSFVILGVYYFVVDQMYCC